MPELLVGLLVGVWMAGKVGFDGSGSAIVGGIAALAAYFLSCAVWPFRDCFLCKGKVNVDDGRGNWRHRWTTCLWCRGAKEPRRLGARLMGRG